MKNLNSFILEHLECPKLSIIERLKLNKDTKLKTYNYFPKSFDELRALLRKLLEERGPDADLNDIDVSNVTTFSDTENDIGLFEDLDPHNIKIDRWDVSNVKNMNYMFSECENFNCNLSNWKVNKVKYMRWMFDDCKNFNCDLSKWDVSNVKDMFHMFDGCVFLQTPNWYKINN